MFKRELVEDFFLREIKFEGVERELRVEEPKVKKVVSIVGPRRSGKTWYFYYLFKKFENPMYVNLEDIAFRNISIEEFFDLLKIFSELKYEPKTLFLDEVQNLMGWQVLVRSLHDRDYKVFVTGSSSKLLPKEISTELRGRTFTYILLPFSFREFVKSKMERKDIYTFEGRGRILRFLREYLEFGGYPEVVFEERKEKFLREYFDEIFYKDFVERHRIKSFEFGRFLFEFIFQNFSKEMSIKKIKLSFGKNISERTLYTYVDKLEDTLTVFFVRRFSESIYVRESWPRKVFICDTGLSKILRFSPDIGKLMENTVFLDLVRRTNTNPLLEIFYLKIRNGEVDFVVKEGLRIKQLIQVAYASGRDEIEKREIKALIKASDLLKCRDLVVITWDYEDKARIGNCEIIFKPLWKWLILH
jgi:predicted AAA+ superfamily ATPase